MGRVRSLPDPILPALQRTQRAPDSRSQDVQRDDVDHDGNEHHESRHFNRECDRQRNQRFQYGFTVNTDKKSASDNIRSS